MNNAHHYLAVDLGAERGRTILGALDGDRLTLTETHHFPNGPVQINDGIHWDVLRLWSEIKSGIAATVKKGGQLDGVGLDTWGVDFALLGRNHSLLSNPFHPADWDGWVQERGLYFGATWDPRYQPLVRLADPGEPPIGGALLVARHGKGRFIYTGLAFFRQPPAGLPGAYRLLANLIGGGAP